MTIDLITRKDLDDVKYEIFEIIERILSDTQLAAQFMKSYEVQGILKCSSGVLANLRVYFN